jgi:hypothetical protein
MSHFEYISVAVSIVLSLTVVRLLDSLPRAVAVDKRYWIHGVWVLFLLLWSAVFWWLSWSHSRADRIAFPTFLAIVTPPAILYLCASALVSHAPADVPSWREHYWHVRQRFFALALAFLATLVFTSTVLQGVPLRHPIRIAQAVLATLFTIGLVSRSERTHATLAALVGGLALLAIALSALGLLAFDLGAR